MKRFIYILTLLFVCTSCVGELGMDDGHKKKDGIVLTIYNAPLTKALDNSGEAYERELKTLDIFFYPKGQTAAPCVFYHHVDLNATFGQTEVNIYVVEDAISKIFPTQNVCDIFVIANLPADVKPADAAYAAGSEDTRLPVLEGYVLDNSEANYDAINKPFVMAGLGTAQRDSKKNAEGTISLIRAASKITLTVAIPDYIDIENTINGITHTIRMVHTYEDAPDVNTMNVSFHNGVYKGYLFKEVDETMEDFHISSSKQKFTYSKTLPAEGSTPQRRVYTCDIPFYTYAHQWEKGAADASYVTFEMKWGADKGDGSTPIYETYYYQILINGAGRTFQPNHWYDMYVNVGVIGSTIEIKPIVLDHLEFFVLDWSDHISGVDHPKEDVEFKDYMYFNVMTERLELDNVTTGVIQYKASHKIAWSLDTSNKVVEDVETLTTNLGAFYIDCRATTTAPGVEGVSGFTLTDNGDGILQYDYTIPDNIYSPVYIYLTLWLELDGVNGMGETERPYSESVTIVQYPPIYILPELSVVQSVYVNGNRATQNATHNAIYINGQTYDLGGAYGQDNSRYMHTIHVSSFNINNTFEFDGNDVSYIIGDPRVRVSDINLNNDGYDMKANNAWAMGYTKDGSQRRLAHYYPTGTEGEIYRVISPKFRVSSKLGGYSEGDREGVAMRCASYQENGYPAGRWRVPTTAEIAFIVYLQTQEAIPELFVNNHYFSSTHMVTQGNNKADIEAIDEDDHSVRCVYDEWYWGSEQDAVVNPGTNATAGNHYRFTWGDEEITW